MAICGIAIVSTIPLEAQTTATLNVTARVVEECTVGVLSRRERVKLARRLNDPTIIRRCSTNVQSRVDQNVTRIATINPPVRQRVDVSSRSSRRQVDGEVDVFLVTFTY